MANSNKYASMISKIKQDGRSVVESDLIKDKDWIQASKIVYKMDNGDDFQGNDEDAVKYGIDRMSKFNYNVTLGTVPDAVNISKKTMDEKVAFMYLMDTYDDKDITWAGVGRALGEMATDPLTYAGMGVGKIATRSGAKEAMKRTLMSEIKSFAKKPIVQGATGGATYAGGFNLAQQKVAKEAGIKQEISGEEMATHGAIGATVGAGFVKGADMAIKALSKESATPIKGNE